jgi:hypothetical protein
MSNACIVACSTGSMETDALLQKCVALKQLRDKQRLSVFENRVLRRIF